MKITQMISKLSRGHSDLNQGPAGLQPDALPLSYISLHCQIIQTFSQTNLLRNKRLLMSDLNCTYVLLRYIIYIKQSRRFSQCPAFFSRKAKQRGTKSTS
jgi:hypothetical protein